MAGLQALSLGASAGIAVLLLTRFGAAETVAVVTASPAAEAAVEYLLTQIDVPVVRRQSPNARHLEALIDEARAGWREDLVVVLDSDRATVAVLRPWDGTMGSRSLAPSVARAPYVVALAAVELLELVRAAAPARAAALPEPSQRPLVTRLSLDLGIVQSASADGGIGLLQPTMGIDLQAVRAPDPVRFAIGVHATGLSPMRRDQVLQLPSGSDPGGTMEYSRNELSLRFGVGHHQGVGAAVGWCDVGLAFIEAKALDAGSQVVASDARSAFWLGLGGELRYTIGAGFALGIGAGAAWYPVTSRFYASPPGAPGSVAAFDEGSPEFRARLAVVWEAPP